MGHLQGAKLTTRPSGWDLPPDSTAQMTMGERSTVWLSDPTSWRLRSCKCLELMLFFQLDFPSPSMLNHSKQMPTQQRVNETPQLLCPVPVISRTFWCQRPIAEFSFVPWSSGKEVKRTKCKWNMGTGKGWEHRQNAAPSFAVIQQRAERNTAESEAGTAKSIWCQENRRNPRAGSSWHSEPRIAISKATQSGSVLAPSWLFCPGAVGTHNVSHGSQVQWGASWQDPWDRSHLPSKTFPWAERQGAAEGIKRFSPNNFPPPVGGDDLAHCAISAAV